MALAKKIRRDATRIKNTLQRAEVARRRLSGESLRTIAQQIGCSPATVRALLDDSIKEVIALRLDEDQLAERFPRPAGENDARALALQMRGEGYTFIEIAKRFEQSDVTVQRWIQQELVRLDSAINFDTHLLRNQELLRLDRMATTLWSRIDNGDVKAISAMLSIMDRRAKLTGIDAPVKINLQNRLKILADENGLDVEEVNAEAAAIIESYKRGEVEE